MNLRHAVYWVALMLLLLVMTACGAGPTATPIPKPTAAVSPTLEPTPEPPTPTPAPPTPVPPTPTPVPPQATTKQQVNVRQGPGVQFTISGKMPVNTTAVILGKNEDTKWLQLAYPDAQHPSWVASAFVTVTGTIDLLPVVAVAPPPTATPGGPVPTKAGAATPTLALTPPKGTLGFVSFDAGNVTYVLNNLRLEDGNVSAFVALGNAPGDLRDRLRTNAPPFAWSRDGSRVAYVFSPDGRSDLLKVDGSDLVTHQGIASPSWSLDNSTVAYIGMDKTGAIDFGGQAIFTLGPDRKENKFFPARGNESFRGVAYGKWILFVSNFSGLYEIWRLDLDGKGALQLTNDKRENGSPAWSPDGTKFAYYSKQADGTYQIMVADADGKNARKLTNAGHNFTPVWSPDGNWIAFASTRGGSGILAIYVMDRNGGNVKPLADKFAAEAQLPGSWR